MEQGQWTACANGQWTGGFDILTGNAQIRYHFIKRRFSVRSRQGLDKNSTKTVQRQNDKMKGFVVIKYPFGCVVS